MGRRAGEKPLQISTSAGVLRALRIAAVRHQEDVQRERLMNVGPMSAYVLRWFAGLPGEAQLRVILNGKALAERDAVEGALTLGEGLLEGIEDLIGEAKAPPPITLAASVESQVLAWSQVAVPRRMSESFCRSAMIDSYLSMCGHASAYRPTDGRLRLARGFLFPLRRAGVGEVDQARRPVVGFGILQPFAMNDSSSAASHRRSVPSLTPNGILPESLSR